MPSGQPDPEIFRILITSVNFKQKRSSLSPNKFDNQKKLLKACIRYDLRAQKYFYKKYYSFLLAVCLRYAPDRETAVNLLNESYLKIFDSLQGYSKSKGQLKSWMYRIAMNHCIDHCRKESRRRKYEDEWQDSNPEPYIENSALSSLSAEELMALIQSLSPSYRMVFNLFVMEGMSHEEIADHLKISIGSSKSNLHKARKRLQEMYWEMNKTVAINEG
jgi:RNA polymerase sigma-70 factor (ECF subfamily)